MGKNDKATRSPEESKDRHEFKKKISEEWDQRSKEILKEELEKLDSFGLRNNHKKQGKSIY